MACNHCNSCAIPHEHQTEQQNSQKIKVVLYVLSIFFFMIGFIPQFKQISGMIYLASVLLAGYDLIIEGIKNIVKLNFQEDTLMTIAVIAAFALGEFPESCMVVLLFKLGEFLEDKAVERSQSNIQDIVKIKANTANLLLGDTIKVVNVEEIKVGDTILIKAGEKVPVDCQILKGDSQLDTSPITGESIPREVTKGEEILSGSINQTGSLTCKVVTNFKNSTASQIVDLVYEATNNKGKTEKFITKFSKIYTPTVIILAILIAVIPTLFGLEFKTWILRSLVFLVASCPCSLVISVPLSFFSCIGAISKKGMIIKGTKHIENLSKANTICFDKTGTLTTGKMKIDRIKVLNGTDEKTMLQYIYSLEELSNHPISTAIKQKAKDIKKLEVEEYKEIAGHGLYGKIEGKEVLFGNIKLLKKYQVDITDCQVEAIYLAIDKKVAGYITLEEEIRSENSNMVEAFNKVGVKDIVMLTGDNNKQAEKIAKQLKIKQVYAQLLPQEKLEVVKKIKNKGNAVIFVGDGINDSPVLATSDFGISMGTGTEIAASSADGILLSNRIASLPNIITIAKKSMNIIKFNITFSLFIKLIVLIMGIAGVAPIWLAILADTGVTLLTVLNSVRIFNK